MIFLPLGLNSKVYKIPWATCTLIMALIVISFKNFEAVKQASHAYTRSETFFSLLEYRLSLASEICHQRSQFVAEATCESIHKFNGQKIHHLTEPLMRIHEDLAKSGIKINSADNATLQELLFDSKVWPQYEPLLTQSRNWTPMLETEQAFRQEVLYHQKQHSLLSRLNWNFLTLSKAQFIHGGLMHLFSNLLFFAFLSVFVELRVGSLLYVFLYFLGGYTGLSAQLLLSDSGSITPLMGASANISGIAGAFTVFFWKKQLRVWSYFLIDSRILNLPVYFFFPVLVFAGDLLGALNSNEAGVAHWAHLGGFMSGALIALSVRKLDNLPQDFSYLEEHLLYRKSFQLKPESRRDAWLELLKINPENQTVHKSLLASFAKEEDFQKLPQNQKFYLQHKFADFLAGLKRSPGELFDVLDSLALAWPRDSWFRQFSTKDLRGLYLQAMAKQRTRSAYILLDGLLQSHPKLRQDPELKEQRQGLLKQLQGTPHAVPP